MKREADSYITSENWLDQEGTGETEDDGENKPFQKASESVLSKRQIKVPKRRVANGASGGSNAPKNAFASFSFGSPAPAPPTFSFGSTANGSGDVETKDAAPSFSFGSSSATSSSNPAFSFGTSPSVVTAPKPGDLTLNGTNKLSDSVPSSLIAPSIPQPSKSSLFSPPPAQSLDLIPPALSLTKPTSSLEKDESESVKLYALQLRGLNESILSEIKKLVEKDAFTDLSEVLKEYSVKRTEIVKKNAKADELLQKGKAVSNDGDKKKDVVSSAPKSTPPFSMPAPPKPPAGSVGIAPFSSSTTSSTPTNSDTKPSGFGFKPPAAPVTTSSTSSTTKNGVSRAEEITPIPIEPKPTSTGFAFGSAPTSSTPTVSSKSSTPFSFGSTSSTSTKTDTTSKPAFSFGASTDTPRTESVPSKTESTPAPAFKFGGFGGTSAATAVTSSSETTSSTTSFAFAKPPSAPSSSFGFGNKPDATTSTESSTPATKAPTFNFGSGTSSTSAATGFSFGSSSTTTASPVESKPAFSFGSSTSLSSSATEGKPAFSFGSNTTPSPSSSATDSKPAFSFGSAAGSTTTPLFGSTTSTGFGFGFKPATPTSADLTSAAPTTATTNVTEDGGDDQEEMPAEEQLGDALMKGAGEETEETIHEIRAKLFVKGSESETAVQWQTAGVGVLRLNRDTTTGKTRLLLRSDGIGRVLLNASIYKDMPVKRPSGNVLLLVCGDAEGQLKPHQVRVKTKENADALLSALEKAKSEVA